MKKITFVLLLGVLLIAGIFGQQIRASSLEGRWVWDNKGDYPPEFTELVFFGNIILLAEEDYPDEYFGMHFTYTAAQLSFSEYYYDYEWEYRLSGNTLLITDEFDDHFTYTRAAIGRSPIQGIWQLTGGTFYDPHDEPQYFVFVGDVLAIGEEEGYEAARVEYRGTTILYDGELFLEYRLSGSTIFLIDEDGDEYTCRKIY